MEIIIQRNQKRNIKQVQNNLEKGQKRKIKHGENNLEKSKEKHKIGTE